jgi:small subunit ribosomal protein S16
MLTIRLSRFGKKKHPVFRVIVSEKAKDTVGDYLELLGTYDPHTNKVELKTERVQYWLAKGASASGVVHNLLIDQKLITGDKIKVANIRKKAEDSEPKGGAGGPDAERSEAEGTAPGVKTKAAEAPKVEEPKIEAAAATPPPSAEAPKTEEAKPAA